MPFRFSLAPGVTALILLLGSSLLTPAARADGLADEAEVNFRLGAERYQTGDFRSALALFLASQRLVPNRNVRFNIVRTFQRLAMYPEAYRWCEEALHEETDPVMRAELTQLLALIERDVAVLEVVSDPPGATIFIDRVDLGSLATTPARLALPEGEHQVILQLAGYQTAEPPPVRVAKRELVAVSARLERIVGRVQIDAAAPSEVRVDGEAGAAQCATPCLLELTPGPHVLYFRRPGYRTAPRQVRVLAGQRSQISVEAQPLTGSIVVTTDVRDARVEVDGEALGFTPTVVNGVPVGRRKLRITLAGYEPIERDVEVLENKVSELGSLSLVPSRQVTAAARVSQSIDEAPASVSVISAQELEAFRYPTIAEALRGQRGVAIGSDGVYTGLTIRGLGQPGDYGNRVLVLSDGATLNDNILWQSYVGYDGRVDLGDLERVELVRGPGSVLYGTGAVTGLVNLVPRALPDRPISELRIQANDARTARARASYTLPLGARRGLSLSLSGGHSEGRRVRAAGAGRRQCRPCGALRCGLRADAGALEGPVTAGVHHLSRSGYPRRRLRGRSGGRAQLGTGHARPAGAALRAGAGGEASTPLHPRLRQPVPLRLRASLSTRERYAERARRRRTLPWRLVRRRGAAGGGAQLTRATDRGQRAAGQHHRAPERRPHGARHANPHARREHALSDLRRLRRGGRAAQLAGDRLGRRARGRLEHLRSHRQPAAESAGEARRAQRDQGGRGPRLPCAQLLRAALLGSRARSCAATSAATSSSPSCPGRASSSTRTASSSSGPWWLRATCSTPSG